MKVIYLFKKIWLGLLNKLKNIGNDGFYKGEVAELLVNQIKEMGGYITH